MNANLHITTTSDAMPQGRATAPTLGYPAPWRLIRR